MNQSLLIPVLSFLVLLAIALLFLYLHLKSVRDELVSYWNVVLDKLRIRDDMVPNLIETVRKYTRDEEKLFQEMIQLRSKSWPMEEANGHKVDLELSLTECLHAAWKIPQKISGLHLDTNFLSLKKDFHDLGKEIDQMVDVYNKKVRSFNKRVGFIFLRPFFALVRLKKFHVFEFEP